MYVCGCYSNILKFVKTSFYMQDIEIKNSFNHSISCMFGVEYRTGTINCIFTTYF